VEHCTKVEDCEVLLFPCVPLAGNVHMVPCLVVERTNCDNGLALDSVFCSQDCLCDVLAEGMVKQSPQEQAEFKPFRHVGPPQFKPILFYPSFYSTNFTIFRPVKLQKIAANICLIQ
jgi:hypothetical protein